MSASAASNRLINFTTYRTLLRTGLAVEQACQLSRPGGLPYYLKQRYRQVAYSNLAEAAPPEVIETQANRLLEYCDAMTHAEGDPQLRSLLDALSLGVGSTAYCHRLEHGYLQLMEFRAEQAERNEDDDELSAERQNRVLLQATKRHISNLSLLYRKDLDNEEALADAMASPKAHVQQFFIQHGHDEKMVLEVDESLNRQVVYVRTEEYEAERHGDTFVEILESPELRGTVCHAMWYRTAQRLVDSLLEETPIHRARGTVLVGHRSSGAVAVVMALLLNAKGFTVKNTITFGGMKVISKTLDRYADAINVLRVVIDSDPYVPLPATASDYTAMSHYGEMLLLNPKKTTASEGAADGGTTKDGASASTATGAGAERKRDLTTEDGDVEPFSCEHYNQVVHSDTVELAYGEGGDVWEEPPSLGRLKGPGEQVERTPGKAG